MADQTDLSGLFDRMIVESEARPIRTTKIHVVDSTLKPGASGPSFGFPGTITVFFARKGSNKLGSIRSAIGRGGEELTTLAGQIGDPFAQLKEITTEGAAQMMIDQAVFAEIRYGGATLNNGLFLPPGIDLAFTMFPYNGGRLLAGGFSLVEYHKEGSKEALEALVVRADPPLTPAERQALRKVPSSQVGHHVGTALGCDTTWWAVGLVVGTLAAAVTLGAAAAA